MGNRRKAFRSISASGKQKISQHLGLTVYRDQRDEFDSLSPLPGL